MCSSDLRFKRLSKVGEQARAAARCTSGRPGPGAVHKRMTKRCLAQRFTKQVTAAWLRTFTASTRSVGDVSTPGDSVSQAATALDVKGTEMVPVLHVVSTGLRATSSAPRGHPVLLSSVYTTSCSASVVDAKAMLRAIGGCEKATQTACLFRSLHLEYANTNNNPEQWLRGRNEQGPVKKTTREAAMGVVAPLRIAHHGHHNASALVPYMLHLWR